MANHVNFEYSTFMNSKGTSMLSKFALLMTLVFALAISAQTVKDFNVTDSKGNTYNLYSLLEDGKHVVLHFTSTN